MLIPAIIPSMDEKTDRPRPTTSKLPTHDLYLVREGLKESDKGFWKRIGAAWPHKDAKGFNIALDGDLVLRERKPKEAAVDKVVSSQA